MLGVIFNDMSQRNKILCAVFVLTAVAALIIYLFGKDPTFVLVMGGLALFMVFALWETPPKHKEFSYRDQQRAFRAFDRSDLLKFILPNRNKKSNNT